ncbi:TatD family hydrolase [Thalassotalea sediminis]|uniref:TatD family hydrolase n=1 Tax=Thalassotalea sediminis TaxID=1759089 RepID=UPI002574669A|nr:TatD family hydrolase [Thalassotalea sediminis]
MIDIGVNLTSSRFDKDRADVISRAKAANISGLLVTGTNVKESKHALALCQHDPYFLYATAGVHPHDADHVEHDYIEQLRRLTLDSNVKAIGECGLDYNRNFSTPDNQKQVFSEQLALAAEVQLPVFLHQRDAFEPWLEIILPYVDQIPNFVSHCFTGSKSELDKCLEHDMYIGVTGWVCDVKRGGDLREAVKHLPLERLMIETDAPYLTPKTIRPRPKSSRNEPAYLSYVVQELSVLTGYSTQSIVQYSEQNSRRVFGLEQ